MTGERRHLRGCALLGNAHPPGDHLGHPRAFPEIAERMEASRCAAARLRCAPGVCRRGRQGAQLSDCSPGHASALRWGAMLYRELMECSGDLLCSRYRLDPDADENAESDERGGAKQREVDLFEGAEPTNG